VLGPHLQPEGRVVIRASQPAATDVAVRLVDGETTHPMRRVNADGLFEVMLDVARVPDYRLTLTFPGDHQIDIDDPYRYGRVLTDFDMHLLGEGTHQRAFEKLGSHRIRVGAATGVHFAVWAPTANRVSVIGDFNHWDGRTHPMRRLSPSGVWEIFIPDLPDGQRYKFEILTATGALLKKTDPYAVAFETPPQTACSSAAQAPTRSR